MRRSSLEELFVDGLKDMYSAENQILRSLPKMSRSASDDSLREALRTHKDETEDQIERLDRIFEMIGKKPGRRSSEAMRGIIEEGDETVEEFKDSDVADAGLAASAQTVEHYEISRYTVLKEWAEALQLTEASGLIGESLKEETEMDRVLGDLAASALGSAAVGRQATSGQRKARSSKASAAELPKV